MGHSRQLCAVEAILETPLGLGGLEADRLDIPTLRERRRFYRICPKVANMFLRYCNCLTYKVISLLERRNTHNNVNLRTEGYP